MKKRILSILLALVLCFGLLPAAALAAGSDVWDGSTQTPSGSGTSESDPYLISTGEELAWLSSLTGGNYTNYYVKLTNDIILNEGTFDSNGNLSTSAVPKEWTPAQKAVWHIDGNHHYILGLYINSDSADYVGLFSYLYSTATNKSCVKDLTIKNSYVRLTRDNPQYGNGYAGVFAGKSYGTDFTNCFSENNIASTYCYVTGGIVGASDNCSFNGVHTSGSVNGSKIIGGIAGYDDSGTFKNCWNEAKISNEKESIRQSGGIAGQALNSNFYNCANLGSLYGGSRVGGIVGEAKGVTIKNCYGLKSIQEYKIDWKGYGTYTVGTLVGTTGASVSLSYAEDGFERNDNGENGVVPHFTGKGKLTESGDENELLNALNENLYEMDGEEGLNKWSRTNDGYPLPNGGTFVNTAKYYNIWLDGVRVSERNQDDILKDGLASYNNVTNTLSLHDGLVVTRAYNNSLLYTEGDINLCVDGSVEFRSAQNVGGSPIVINLGEATAGGNLRIYAPEGKSAAVTVTGAYTEYGIDVHSLTLGGDVCLTVRTTGRQCFAACSTITLQSAEAVLDAENLSGGHSMLNFVYSVNLPSTNPQKLYEGTGTDLKCVTEFTKERKTESGTTERYMYPHIRIAPEVYELIDTLPKSLTVSMTEANTQAALATWAAGQIRKGDITASNSEITVSDVVSAVAGSDTNQSGTDGSFTVTVKLTKNGISKTTTIPGTITATAYTALSHIHNWASEWTNNETHHWHECTVDGCDVTDNAQKDGYGAHIYDDDADTTCNTCGYERTIESAHTHCVCGGDIDVGDHTAHTDVTFQPWDGTSAIDYGDDNTAYVCLEDNVTIQESLEIRDGKTLYLCLNGKTFASNGTKKIEVWGNSRFILCDCAGGGTIDGADSSWGGAGIYLHNSTMDMYGGKITGGHTGNGGGGAIALDDVNCVFNMYGGEISGNKADRYGGAIFLNGTLQSKKGGTVNIYGGTISGNNAKIGGAIYSVYGGTVNLYGGEISGNKATANGGGAICLNHSGVLNMTGGKMQNNTAKTDGGAVNLYNSTFKFSGGTISNNHSDEYGGAIYLSTSCKLDMTDGEICNNTAKEEGGAVHVYGKNSTFTLSGGTITGNEAVDGGAVYLNQELSTLNMTGGEISGNKATRYGGAVYMFRATSTLNLSGGTIKNNTAGSSGGAVYFNTTSDGKIQGILNISGNPVVKDNTVSDKANNIYLKSGKTLSIVEAMTDGASVGITTESTNYPVVFSNAYSTNYKDYFFADDAAAYVEYNADKKLQLAHTHKMTFVPATSAGCTTQGNTAYYVCDSCGKWYRDAAGTTEITDKNSVVIAPTNHSWNEPTYEWSADGKACTAKRVCKNDANHTETATATVTSEVTKPATCTEAGETTYTANFADSWATTQTKTLSDIDALKHDFTGDYDGYDEDGHWHVCNRTGCTETDTKQNHSFTSYTYNNDATYFADGTETAVCDAAGCLQTHTRTAEDTKLVDSIAPTGEITVKENTWKSFINTITFGIFCKDKYDVTVTAADAETGVASVEYLLSETAIPETHIASQTGWKTYAAFSLENEGKYIIYAKITDNAGNVTYISSDGLVLDKTAPLISGLENNKTYCEAVTFTVDDEYIDYVTVNGEKVTDYTLAADGTTYTVKAYDKAGNESLTYTVTVSNGHSWNEPTYEWSADGKTCTAKRICKNNASHTETATATVTSEVTKPATCTEGGKTTYTATFTKDWATAQTKVVDDIAPTNHSWSEPTYEWSEDGKVCTAKRICKNDANHTETATATVASEVTKSATCTEGGKTTYTATFTKDWATTQTKVVDDIAPTNHSWNEPTYEWSADGKACTAKRICKNDANHTETATATVSSEVTKPATCTEAGETTYTANFADSWATTQTKVVADITATGHSWNESTYERNTEKHWLECECGAKKDENAHTYGEWTVTKKATETAKGEKEHTCTVCGYTEKAEIAKLPETDTTKPGTGNPGTGDNSNLTLWFALLAASTACLIGTGVYCKRRRSSGAK